MQISGNALITVVLNKSYCIVLLFHDFLLGPVYMEVGDPR